MRRVRAPVRGMGRVGWFARAFLALGLWGLGAEGASSVSDVCQRRQIGTHMCPELFVIGVQKGGSSSLYVWIHWVMKEKQIAVANYEELWQQKEPHFFDIHYNEGLEWYSRLYPVRESDSDLAMDCTPDYYRDKNAPERMLNSLAWPRLRFIISFRDPAARAYSWYKHIISGFLAPGNQFERALYPFDFKYSIMERFVPNIISQCLSSVSSPSDVIEKCHWGKHSYGPMTIPETNQKTVALNTAVSIFFDGLYGYYMQHWFKYFKPEQFCIVFYENLVLNFPEEMTNLEPCLTAFGIHQLPESDEEMPLANEGGCTDCERLEILTAGEKHEIGVRLNGGLFKKSNELLRGIIGINYGRRNMVRWENMYKESRG